MKILSTLLTLVAFIGASSITHAADSKTAFETAITQNLVQLKDGKLQPIAADSLGAKDYYAIYYSAHWCPPCRKFTPKLVDYYNEAKGHHDNFEVIFVSSDRSASAMEGYMKETGMKWYGLQFDKKKESKEVTQFVGRGIPHLVVVDKNGKILSDSVVDGQYVGPYKVLDDLKDILHQ
ncbi:thioredoxin-like domain-containing protein [Coraliomargarita akajimensis]|uniref:Redoxin domain protein n=1 Tax=Coraliomargarita akajimensis (strain DSM 45221 / IAM 15411 / JCM 23193 / KCTC 12865 / 04OKA010-24) TaxID=583355 RepID=D5EIY4_CORAD|nr:thioredoxin-like domain-containing protein [Coraliomargarita akajimensis]ADE54383.1 Redoxin domain protein [Coraliomargarita akajimensis DSM 45221]